MAKKIKIAELVAEALLDNKRFKAGMKGMQSATNRGVGQMVRRLATLGISFIAIRKLIDFVKKSIIGTTATFESLNLRFEQLIGNTAEAKRQFGELVKFSTKTPFKIQEVVEAAAGLEAFGAKSEDLIVVMGDLAAFMGITIPEAASAFGRAFAAGAGAADILKERGVLNLIKLQTGIDDLTKLSLPKFRQAMIDAMTDPSGKIAGGAEKLAGTLAGKWSTFVGEVDLLWVKIGNSFLKEMKHMVNIGIAFVQVTRDNFGTLAEAVKADWAKMTDFDKEDSRWLQIKKWFLKEMGETAKGIGHLLFDDVPEGMFDKTTMELKRLGSEFDRVLEKLEAPRQIERFKPRALQTVDLNKPKGFDFADKPLEIVNRGLDASVGTTEDLKKEMDRVGQSIDEVASKVGNFVRGLREGKVSLGGMLSLLALIPGLGSLGTAGTFFTSAGFKQGGGGRMGPTGHIQAATGIKGIVPAGFANDTFTVGVTSGERVNVETIAQARATDRVNAKILGSLNALNANVSMMGARQDLIEATVNIKDRDLQLLVEKSEARQGINR